MTELSPVSHVTPPGKTSPGSVGAAVAEHRGRGRRPGDRRGPRRRRGRRAVGPRAAGDEGLPDNPEATAATIDADGWLHTGDIGHVDDDGHVFIVDRVKELIKYKGFQVPPAELEALLLTHPAVADAAVIGLPDEEAGEMPEGVRRAEAGRDAPPRRSRRSSPSRWRRTSSCGGRVHRRDPEVGRRARSSAGCSARRVAPIRGRGASGRGRRSSGRRRGHGAADVGVEQLRARGRPPLTGGAEPVEVRAADHPPSAPSGDRLHDVAAAPHAAVADDLDAVTDRVGDRRDQVEIGGRAVELAAAVVRQRDGVDAGVGGEHRVVHGLDALDHDGPVPHERSHSTSAHDRLGSNCVLM